jgi:hypothetical protein
VSPKSGLSTGQQIDNNASVVFDRNAAVVTPAWGNTLDNSSPMSRVLGLTAYSPANFTVSWQGMDIGSGLKDYTIYVSNNGSPFAPWLTYTTATSAVYTGVSGRSYRFHSIARDFTNNIEPSKIAAEAATIVQFAGTLGSADCEGKSVSALVKQYGGLDAAAKALGYPNVSALQDAIRAYCGG